MNKTTLTIVMVIVLIVAVGGIVYTFGRSEPLAQVSSTPSPIPADATVIPSPEASPYSVIKDPTSFEWQVLTSIEHNFEIKFPADWRVRAYTSNQKLPKSEDDLFGFAPKEVIVDTYINLSIEDKQLSAALADLSKTRKIETEELTLEKGEGVRVSFSAEGVVYTNYLFAYNGKLYSLVGGSGSKEIAEVYKAMALSFRFTE